MKTPAQRRAARVVIAAVVGVDVHLTVVAVEVRDYDVLPRLVVVPGDEQDYVFSFYDTGHRRTRTLYFMRVVIYVSLMT